MRLTQIIFSSFFLFSSLNSIAQESHDFEISKNLDVYTSLIQQLNLHYVDEIQPGALTEAAIDAMLAKIDPYTVYYPEAEIEDVRFMQTGQYGGIGSFIHLQDGNVVVGMPYPGFPFYNAGLRAGDVILSIDGDQVHGKTMEDISDKLRGAAGTSLTIKYISSKTLEEYEISLKRMEIEVKDVPYFSMVSDGVAYVKLTGFKQNAAQEVKIAIDSLSKTNTLSGLVLDVRDNGGGLLIQAVNIMDFFVGPNELIVSTKGKTKEENNSYKTQMPAVYEKLKVAVLTNPRSASASEIVAGAFQDLDRGIIIGQKTYGKGLVQKVYPLSYRSQAKITVAKYYIPSGRCIQSLDYQHRDASGKAIVTPDSLMASFKTQNGRLVRDAGGIIPDVPTDEKDIPEVVKALVGQYAIFDFATHYVNSHDSILQLDAIVVDDQIYNDFLSFLVADSFSYKNVVDIYIEKLQASISENNLALEDEINLLKAKNESIKKIELEYYKKEISENIRKEIVSRYFFITGQIQVQLQSDKDLKKAIDLLNNSEEYNRILGK